MEILSHEDPPASGGRDVLTRTPAAQRTIRQGQGALRLRLMPRLSEGWTSAGSSLHQY